MSRDHNLASQVKSKRDHTCEKCGYTPSTDRSDRIEAHHVVPIMFDGEDSKENIIILCNICHEFAPTETLPKNIVNTESPDSISVENNQAIREYFENIAAEYISTGTPPIFDLYVFGMMAASKGVYDEVDEFEFLFDMLGSLFSEVDLPIRSQETMWLAAAEMAGYIESDHIDGRLLFDENEESHHDAGFLTGGNGQLQFTQSEER